MNKQAALEQLDRKAEVLFSIGDAVWDHPETGYAEEQSSAILKQVLEQEGFAVQSDLDGIPTAFSGTYGSGAPVIGILGEFDALPGLSQRAGITHPEPLVEGATAMAAATICWGQGASPQLSLSRNI